MKPGPPQDHKTNHRAAPMSDRFRSAVILAPLQIYFKINSKDLFLAKENATGGAPLLE